jgi:DNA-binding MarR family transcriptional regulator
VDIEEMSAYTSFMAGFTSLARKIAKECSGMRVRQVSRLLTRVYDDSLRRLGIQASQLSVLIAVAMFGEGGAPMGRLASALVMDRTTLTRNLVPLEKEGLLRVARSAEDARARIVVLTKGGERMIESAYPLWETAQKRIRQTLGVERFESLRAQLAEVVGLSDELEPGDL